MSDVLDNQVSFLTNLREWEELVQVRCYWEGRPEVIRLLVERWIQLSYDDSSLAHQSLGRNEQFWAAVEAAEKTSLSKEADLDRSGAIGRGAAGHVVKTKKRERSSSVGSDDSNQRDTSDVKIIADKKRRRREQFPSDGKKFTCTYVDPITQKPCGAALANHKTLRQHFMQLHDKNRPACKQCGRRFGTKAAAVRHS
jgi:hypothetical protein